MTDEGTPRGNDDKRLGHFLFFSAPRVLAAATSAPMAAVPGGPVGRELSDVASIRRR